MCAVCGYVGRFTKVYYYRIGLVLEQKTTMPYDGHTNTMAFPVTLHRRVRSISPTGLQRATVPATLVGTQAARSWQLL